MQLLQFYATVALVLYIEQVTGHTVDNGRFLYSRAPVQLVEEARAIGEYGKCLMRINDQLQFTEKQLFHKEVAKLANNGQDKRYAVDYLSKLTSCLVIIWTPKWNSTPSTCSPARRLVQNSLIIWSMQLGIKLCHLKIQTSRGRREF
jgi:hypothetical protein